MNIFTSSQHAGLVNLNEFFGLLCRNFYTTAYQEKLQNHLYRCLTFYCVNSKEHIMLSPNVLYQRLLFKLYNNRKIVCRAFCMMAYLEKLQIHYYYFLTFSRVDSKQYSMLSPIYHQFCSIDAFQIKSLAVNSGGLIVIANRTYR